jgi:hypothetical protein
MKHRNPRQQMINGKPTGAWKYITFLIIANAIVITILFWSA